MNKTIQLIQSMIKPNLILPPSKIIPKLLTVFTTNKVQHFLHSLVITTHQIKTLIHLKYLILRTKH